MATTEILFADSPAFDAFGRLRVSQPISLFDGMAEYSDDPAFWESLTSGGTVAHVPNQCAVRLSTAGATAGNYAYRATRSYLRYQPGRSLNIETTFVMSAHSDGARARIGYFDAFNGIFLERGARGDLRFVRRTRVTGTAVDNVVEQADWNVDPLDGSGPSGIDVDVTKAQILFIQLQFLGVGRVQVGFVVDGLPYVAHEWRNANSLGTVYMSTGCLPVRAEVQNVATAGGATTLDMICTSVSSGGIGANQKQFSRANAIAGRATSTSLLPLISIRAATLYGGTGGGGSIANRGHILPKAFELIVGAQNHQYSIVLNPTLTGASWQTHATTSIADYDLSATSMSGGTVLDAGFLGAAAATRGVGSAELFVVNPLVYSGLNSVQDTVTLAVRTLTGTGTANGAITWAEEY